MKLNSNSQARAEKLRAGENSFDHRIYSTKFSNGFLNSGVSRRKQTSPPETFEFRMETPKKATSLAVSRHRLRPAICALAVFISILLTGSVIFVTCEKKYKGIGIVLSTIGFLGCFASSLFFRRRQKEIKKQTKKKLLQQERKKSTNAKSAELVDPLMLRTMTNLQFRACEELQERRDGDDDTIENQRLVPVRHCSYVVVNSSPVVPFNR